MMMGLVGCSSVNWNELENLKHEDRGAYTIISVDYSDENDLLVMDKIASGMKNYFRDILNLKLNRDLINVVILPESNDILSFEKQGSSATTFYKKNIIFLMDFYNLGDDFYEKYGNPPQDILYTAFTHEYAHVLLYQNVSSFKNVVFEAISVFSSMIDFSTPSYSFYDNNDIHNSINRRYSPEKLQELIDKRSASFDLKKDESYLAFLMCYFHEIGEYGYLTELMKSDDLKKSLRNYDSYIYDDYINWIKNYLQS